MPDFTSRPTDPPAGWHEAFAVLPLEAPPTDGWTRLSRRLDARRRFPRWPLPLAAAAVLALAVVPTWLPRPADGPQATIVAHETGSGAVADTDDAMATITRLQAESARLEALLRYARDGRVASGAAAVMAAEFDAQLTAVDAALRQPALDPARRTQLWLERVEVLRAFAGFESTRRWLAANGEHYDGALVRVD